MVRGLRNFFLALYVPILLLYLIASYAMYISPAEWWPVGFFSLAYPFLLALLILFIVLSILIRFRYVWLGVFGILLSFNTISNTIPFRKDSSFTVVKTANDIRVLSWNIRRFTPYYKDYFDPKNNNIDTIISVVKELKPDIICFQEFFTSQENKEQTIGDFKKLGYKYYAFARHPLYKSKSLEEGNIIFSKFPIVRKIGFNKAREVSFGWEEPLFADILIKGDTIRVGTFHLESFGFAQREYEDLAKIHDQNDENLRSSKNIYSKMRSAFKQRGRQADIIHAEIKKSPYPIMVCGDLNDVPSSYAYLTVRGKLNDSFLEQGSGLGKTFYSGRSPLLTWLPTLRIDYIFADRSFDIKQFSITAESLSDHRGVITDFQLPKNQ